MPRPAKPPRAGTCQQCKAGRLRRGRALHDGGRRCHKGRQGRAIILLMFKALRTFPDGVLPLPPAADARAAEHRPQRATAVMLVEVMRADATFHPGERAATQTAL